MRKCNFKSYVIGRKSSPAWNGLTLQQALIASLIKFFPSLIPSSMGSITAHFRKIIMFLFYYYFRLMVPVLKRSFYAFHRVSQMLTGRVARGSRAAWCGLAGTQQHKSDKEKKTVKAKHPGYMNGNKANAYR